MKNTLLVLLIFGCLGLFKTLAQPTAKIYYTDYGGVNYNIYKSNLDGSSYEVLTMPIRPYGIAVDWKSIPQKLYVGLNPTSGIAKIIRCNTDGSNIEDVVTDLISVDDIELDLLNRKIYWAQDTYNNDKISKADMDGLNSNIEEIFSSTAAMVDLWGLALNVNTQTIWFTQRGSTCYSSSIKRMNTNGSNLNTIISPVCNPHDIEYFNGKLYWSNYDGLMKCNTDGSNVDTVLLGPSAYALSIDATNQRIYWTDYNYYRVKCVNLDGSNETDISPVLGTITFIDTDYNPSATDVEDFTQVQSFYYLEQNYPNPFNPSTIIRYTIPLDERRETRNVVLKIYDMLGKEVVTLVNEEKSAGSYEVEFLSTVGNRQLVNGVYFYQLKAENYIQTKKMVLLK